MRGVVAIAVVTAREILTVRSLVVSAVLLMAALGAAFLLPVDAPEARVRFLECAWFGALFVLAGGSTAFVAAAAVRDDLRARRIDALLARPLARSSYFAGKLLGVQIAVAGSVAMLSILGAAGLAGGLRLAGLPLPVSYRWETAVATERPRRPSDPESAQDSWIRLVDPGDEVKLRFEKIPPPEVPAVGSLELRLPIRGSGGATEVRVPVRLAILRPGGKSERVFDLLLAADRIARVDLRPGDVSPRGDLEIAIRRADTPVALGLPEDGVRVRAARLSFLGSFAARALLVVAAGMLLAALGVAFSPALSTPTASFLLLFVFVAGSIRPHLLDLASAIERGTLVAGTAGEGSDLLASLLAIDGRILGGIARVCPPFDLFHPGDLVASASAPGADRILITGGWLAAAWVVAFAVGSALLATRRPGRGGKEAG